MEGAWAPEGLGGAKSPATTTTAATQPDGDTLNCVKPQKWWGGHCNHDSTLVNTGGAHF